MAETQLSFKEMCAKFDVTPRTLRYEEYIVMNNKVREGRSRLYGTREVARMTLILRGRKWGFALEQIRQWLLIYEEEGTNAQLEIWIEQADQQLAILAQQRAELDEAMKELKGVRDQSAAALKKMSA